MHCAIVWFRQDLRLSDNPALSRALSECERVIPLYILDPLSTSAWAPKSASRWWLHHSLIALDEDLARRGSRLLLRSGESLSALRQLIGESGATHLYWNRRYEPVAIAEDRTIKRALRETGLQVESFNAALLREPWQATKSSGQPYRVFTPFYKAQLLQGGEISAPLPPPPQLPPLPQTLHSEPIEQLQLLPHIPWDGGLAACWQPGEAGAHKRLERFLDEVGGQYPLRRDTLADDGTSRLSPHLHFGEIGPRQIVVATRSLESMTPELDLEPYRRQLAWREFGHNLLYHFPSSSDQPLDPRFQDFPWAEPDSGALEAWQRGETGYPIVDAGMRQLWRSGWMHNRARMLTASLLCKNLLIPWQHGAKWFWDTLVDADLANNTLGWQWTAGCGADAAPYFRIFSPIRQAARFDSAGSYIKQWLPELADLPVPHLFAPWEAPKSVLSAAGIELGRDYPHPIVDLASSRQRALAAFETIKKQSR